jgi:hypothetical protein
MKKPRLEDFDPNSTPQLGSPLDKMPTIQPATNTQSTPAVPASDATPVRPDVRTSVRSDARPHDGPPARPSVRRTITRYAFEFYQDQLDTLNTLSLEQKLRGEKGSKSQMVREALDLYFAQEDRTKE